MVKLLEPGKKRCPLIGCSGLKFFTPNHDYLEDVHRPVRYFIETKKQKKHGSNSNQEFIFVIELPAQQNKTGHHENHGRENKKMAHIV